MASSSNSSETSKLPKFKWIDIDSEIAVFDQFAKRHVGKHVKISQYLVTNSQYEAFVRAGGYQNDVYWGPYGVNEENQENGTRPAFERSHWPQPNRPKTNVNWYEAMAFCEWLNKNASVSKPSKEHVFSLLSTAFYDFFHKRYSLFKERAIDDIHRKANVERKLEQTSTVGLYTSSTRGSASLGVDDISDLMGNVWEWCVDTKKSSFPAVNKRDDFAGLRGGAWNGNQDDARFRGYNPPGFRNDLVGFRVCCWLPSNSEL